MSTLQQEVIYFSKLTDRIRKAANKQISSELNSVKNRLIAASPVDTGAFSRAWSVRKTRSNATPNLITGSGLVIENKMDYAPAIEEGIDPASNHPWAVAVRSTKAGKRGVVKRSVESKMLVWSRKAIGGTVRTVLTLEEQRRITKRLQDVVLREM